MPSSLNVAIAGLGTVGAGTVKILQDNAELLKRRCGCPITIGGVSARSRDADRGVSVDEYAWYDDPVEMARTDEIDVVIEMIGGDSGVAKALVETALSNGKHVVTANKALLAHHGTALAKRAEDNNVTLAYEAAVAGGIPIIKGLREGLAANKTSAVYGILNGTCNYILTEMRETGREFADVLDEAQDLGYAEADPSFDIDGVDAAHKLALLSALAFGTEIDFANVDVQGIRHISQHDIRFAEELGFKIKLLGVARQTKTGIEQSVQPCMVNKDAQIAAVEGVFNAVFVECDFADQELFVGRGAGGGPTASAVVADIVDIALGRITPVLGVRTKELSPFKAASMGERIGPYYLRLMVRDEPGVVADISAILRDHDVSLESVLQRSRAPGQMVPIVLTCHDTREADMTQAVKQIAALDSVLEDPRLIRIILL